MRILVIAPSWIGDLVMSQCLYMELKKIYPDSIIDVMAPKWCLDVLKRMPEVSNAILMPIGHGVFNLKERYRLGKELKANHYDQAYILPNSFKSALIPLFAGIPYRRGWIGESRYFILTDYRRNKKDFPKLISRYTSLAHSNTEIKSEKDLKEIPTPKLTVHESDTSTASSKFSINIQADVLGICPGAEFGPTKKWPPEYYAIITDKYLSSDSGREVWIFGSNKDVETAEKLKKSVSPDYQKRVHILAGRTTIEEAIDLLAACKFVICNDSGLMHISAAVGVRVIAIFGSTSTLYTPPTTTNALLVESTEPCHPCFKRQCRYGTTDCLKKLTAEMVWNKICSKWEDIK
ncbi:MAG: lipopolysaccharide heptosyltransferase II [Ruminobacter sp.]|uniref:lipopolysaccharide heptosyltransferase II n=1 Tax=Ruminobacter amylophilus TaxID=867 RepID=A0A662ZJC9_9GAMM|nr:MULTISPECIES: lipopolysaccharide heptosyltransferase II [Ruminobacter]MBQ3775350.1 lipopolysaccharide heptosyltransferase II [Ruminobacter sp.]SFP46580.1 heptosyltransferase-2 [Ruminobacter amylophilus]